MRALVLSGGGVRGSYQVGVLKHLLGERGNQYDIYAGVSVGALNAIVLSQYANGQEKEAIMALEKIWLSIKDSKVREHHTIPYLSLLWESGLYSTEPLRKLLNKYVSVDKIVQSGKLLRVAAVSLTTGKWGVWTEQDKDVVDGVMASSAFPGFLEAIKARDEFWTDGGARTVTPLKDAIDAGADEIDVVLTAGGGVGRMDEEPTTMKVLVRALRIMMSEVIENDLKICQLKNNIEGYRKINLKIYRPSKAAGANSLDFDPRLIRKEIQLGYKDAVNINVQNIV